MPANRINNLKNLKSHRNRLRKSLTSAEAKLWTYLQRSKLGYKFRRQHSVGGYILDFYCPEMKLCVELDGAGHNATTAFQYDLNRTRYLENAGMQVIRFENKLVFENLNGVIAEIRKKLTTPSHQR